MNIEPLNLESQFKVCKLKLYLDQNPEDSHRLAVENYKQWLTLTQAYKRLFEKYELLQAEYSELLIC
ncbi:MAG: hypothetical protein AAF298_09405 [Cyanobacteria bacterium P01_A01_bin.40]